jgi:hypothetical protein
MGQDGAKPVSLVPGGGRGAAYARIISMGEEGGGGAGRRLNVDAQENGGALECAE